MSNFKRILTIGISALMLVAAFSVNAFAAESKFSDVSAKDPDLVKAVALLEGLGVTQGTSDTTFGTNEAVTRQQMAAFIYRLLNEGKSLEEGENHTPFEDLYDDTYFGMVSWAASRGIIKGISATEFDPDGGITLQDAYTMLVRALDYEKDGALGYPFEYIEIAESNGVDLGDGLPSGVDYAKELTRGNIAILLYNTFYAKTGIPEIVEEERLLGKGSENEKYVLEVKEVYPLLCEKIYDVEEGIFIVRETTHYAFNDSKSDTTYQPTKDSAGEGTLHLVAEDSDEPIQDFYITAEELGLTGKADDYIMSGVEVFYTYDEDKGIVDSVLVANALMDVTTASAMNLGQHSASRIKANEKYFYDNNYKNGSLRYDGSATVSGKKMYFYDAPYDFLKPSYSGAETADEKYAARNEDNTTFLDLKALDSKNEYFSYYLISKNFAERDTGKDSFRDLLNQVSSGGSYNVSIYDYDGDGRYEYIRYMPATMGKIDMDDKYKFSVKHKGLGNAPIVEKNDVEGSENIPMIYANGATIDGKEGLTFRDGDFVSAYVNPDANYIYIFGVASAKKGRITNFDTDNEYLYVGSTMYAGGRSRMSFTNFYVADGDKAGEGVHTGFFPFSASEVLNREIAVYSFKSSGLDDIVYYEFPEGAASEYAGEDILIPLESNTTKVRNTETFENEHYLKVWVDGKEQYVLVDVEECFPAPTENPDGTYNFAVTVDEEDGKTYEAYVNKLCTFTKDKKNVYTINSLLHAEDEEGEKDHIALIFDLEEVNGKVVPADFNDKDEVNQAATDLEGEKVALKKISGTRYAIEDNYGYPLIGFDGEGYDEYFFESANINEKTLVILREKGEDEKGREENTFKVLNGAEFTGETKDGTYLTNVQYVYENDGNSKTRVNLVLLYAEYNEEDDTFGGVTTEDSDWRIVKSSRVLKVDEKKYCYSYTLYNPVTGEVETGVKGEEEAASAAGLAVAAPIGAVVEMTSAGTIDDEKKASDYIRLDAETNAYLARIIEVDLTEGALELEAMESAYNDYFTEDEELYTYFELAEDVAVTVITLDSIENGADEFKDAVIAKATLEDLAAAKKELKSFNDRILEDEDSEEYTTEYSNYVKAFVSYDKGRKDKYPIIDAIVIVVNPDEPVSILDIE